jgi:hypothetical protein
MNLNILDITLIIVVVVAAVVLGLYFLSNWANKKAAEQQSMINSTKMTTSILVIDKKKDKLTNANMPKAVVDQIPKYLKFKKMPLVKAKIGPQIMTLICDPKVFKELPVKKQVKVDIAGIYIVGMRGGKTNVPKKELTLMDKIKAKLPKKKAE